MEWKGILEILGVFLREWDIHNIYNIYIYLYIYISISIYITSQLKRTASFAIQGWQCSGSLYPEVPSLSPAAALSVRRIWREPGEILVLK